MNPIRSLALVLAVLILPGLAGFDRALAEHGVHDQAGLFSSAAVRQAGQTINQIYGQFHKDILVETFAAVPIRLQNSVQQDRDAFFNSFLQQRARDARVDGVYMLLMKEPPPHNLRIQIGAGQATRRQLFPRADQDEAVRIAKNHLRSHDYDRALLDTVSAVGDAFRRNSGGVPAVGSAPRNVAIGRDRAESSGGISLKSVLFWGALIVVGLMLLSSLFRRASGPMGGRGGMAAWAERPLLAGLSGLDCRAVQSRRAAADFSQVCLGALLEAWRVTGCTTGFLANVIPPAAFGAATILSVRLAAQMPARISALISPAAAPISMTVPRHCQKRTTSLREATSVVASTTPIAAVSTQAQAAETCSSSGLHPASRSAEPSFSYSPKDQATVDGGRAKRRPRFRSP